MRQEASQTKLRIRVERGIFKRSTRNGETRYEVGYTDSDGYQRWRTVTMLTDARRLRAELVTRVASGERVAPSKVTLEEFAAEWLEQQRSRLRPTTHRLYGSYMAQHVNPRRGTRKLSAITVDDVAALIADMEQGWRYRKRDGRLVRVQGKPFAAWTIRGVLVVLGRVLGRAARVGTINANLVRRLEKEERPKTERREFPSFRALVAVSVLTGIRQGEVLGLRWQDVDGKAGLIHVRYQLDRGGALVKPKTAAAKRDIPIPPSLGRKLTDHKQQAFAKGYATDQLCLRLRDRGTAQPPQHHSPRPREGNRRREAAGAPLA